MISDFAQKNGRLSYINIGVMMIDFDMENDPDRKKFLLLQEQLEFWIQRSGDDSLTSEEQENAQKRYEQISDQCIEVLQRFNKRWREIDGPLPDFDNETLQLIRNKFADMGMEVTLDEINEVIRDDS